MKSKRPASKSTLKLRQAEKALILAVEALQFYADPATYFAVGFLADPPAGDFVQDFDETDLGEKPGKAARIALTEIEKVLFDETTT